MKRTRWTARLAGGALALTTLGGCQKTLYTDVSDYKAAVRSGILDNLENRPHDPIAPSLVNPGQAPATILDPNRPARYVTLKELIAHAAESGNLGGGGGLGNSGFTNENIPSRFTSGGTADSIRANVLDPAITGANIERALSKFDARFINSITWAKQDQAVLNLQQSFSNGDSASFNTTLAKPLATGGVAGITFSTNYQKLANPPTTQGFVALTSSYSPRLQFTFEQPLLQGFGVEINQLTAQHPGSLLINGLRPSGGTTTEGILITRIRYEQQRASFDQALNLLLHNVEAAYWNLYAAYYSLYAQEETLKQAFELYTVIRQRYEAGTLAKQDLTQTESQYWLFRQQVIAARQQVLEAERSLRGLLGSNSFSEGNRLVPTDEPTLAPYLPDYFEAANDALANRPELISLRHDLKAVQLDLILQKNQRRPDLRFFASYDLNGLGSRLDGSRNFQTGTDPTTGRAVFNPQNALASLASNEFNSYQFGLRMEMPLGFRDAHAAVRQGQLRLLRGYYELQDSERKTLEQVTQEWRNVINQHEQINYNRQRRLALQETLRLNRELIEAGNWQVSTLFNLLQVQRDAAQAIATEFQSISLYNISLSRLELVKGTVQRYNNVAVNEGPLPPHVNKRAAEHFSARNAAIELRERPAEIMQMAAPNPTPFLGSPLMPSEQLNVAVPPAAAPLNPPTVSPMQPPVKKMDAPAPKPTGSPTGPVTMAPPTTPVAPMPVNPWPGTFGTPTGGVKPPAETGDPTGAGTFRPIGTVDTNIRKKAEPAVAAPGSIVVPTLPVSTEPGK